jgi:hypothetical protein
MKTVFDTRQLAHLWANRAQPHGRNAGNSTHFDGAVFYSYQTPIAAHIPTARTPRTKEPIYGAVLVTSHTYSVTTSGKHMTAVCRAIPDNVPVFTVPDIGHSGGRARTLSGWPASDPAAYVKTHKANLAWLLGRYHDTVTREMRARQWYAPASEVLLRPWAEVESYARVFKVKLLKRDTPDTVADAAKIEARRERLTAERNSPKYTEKVEKARVQREAARERREATQATQRAEAARIRELQNAARLAEWRTGANVPAPYGEYAALRFNNQEFETSQGARVNLDDARKFYAFWVDVRPFGWLPSPASGDQFHVGPFPLRQIHAGGDVQIGCHKIKAEEIEAFAEGLRIAP